MEQVQFKHEEKTLPASLSLPDDAIKEIKLEVFEAAETGNKSKALEHLYNKYKDDPTRLMLTCFMLGDLISQANNPLAELMAKLGG